MFKREIVFPDVDAFHPDDGPILNTFLNSVDYSKEDLYTPIQFGKKTDIHNDNEKRPCRFFIGNQLDSTLDTIGQCIIQDGKVKVMILIKVKPQTTKPQPGKVCLCPFCPGMDEYEKGFMALSGYKLT